MLPKCSSIFSVTAMLFILFLVPLRIHIVYNYHCESTLWDVGKMFALLNIRSKDICCSSILTLGANIFALIQNTSTGSKFLHWCVLPTVYLKKGICFWLLFFGGICMVKKMVVFLGGGGVPKKNQVRKNSSSIIPLLFYPTPLTPLPTPENFPSSTHIFYTWQTRHLCTSANKIWTKACKIAPNVKI